MARTTGYTRFNPYGPNTPAVEKVLGQIAQADPLMWLLADLHAPEGEDSAVVDTSTYARRKKWCDSARKVSMAVSRTEGSGWRLAEWAVISAVLADKAPEAAAKSGAGWSAVTQASHQLSSLGEDGEQVFWSLVDGWKGNALDLVSMVEAILA